MMRRTRIHSKGVTLVELMVSISLGCMVLLMISSTVASLLNSKHMTQARLQNELQSMASYVERDLMRAGYWGYAAQGLAAGPQDYANPFAAMDTSTPGCVLYSYDANHDGSVTQDENHDERFALVLDGGALFVRISGEDHNCDVTEGVWESLNDPKTVQVSTFTVSVTKRLTDVPGTDRKLATRSLTYHITAAPKQGAKAPAAAKATITLPNDVLEDHV